MVVAGEVQNDFKYKCSQLELKIDVLILVNNNHLLCDLVLFSSNLCLRVFHLWWHKSHWQKNMYFNYNCREKQWIKYLILILSKILFLSRAFSGASFSAPALIYTIGFFFPFFSILISYLMVLPIKMKKISAQIQMNSGKKSF